MIPIITVLLGLFLFLFGNVAIAKSFGSTLCSNDSQFNCYTVKKGETWDNLFTDPTQRDLVMRINRINIPLHSGRILAVPKNLSSATMMDYAPLSKQIDPPGTKVIIVSINHLAFGAYDAQGTLEYWGPISAGRHWCADINRGCQTVGGKFSIYRKGGAKCVSSKYPIGRGGAPTPYCMFFHGGYALHGSYTVPGYNDSHGCVRLFVNDAQWLNQEFTRDSKVTVYIKK